MDFDSSTKFISSLGKFLQSLCNGYVEFDSGVEVIGHIYLSVDTGKKIDYILNEKVCKTDENSVTFISNSFHAQPAEKPKPAPKPSKSSEPEKPLDPGGSGSQDDEILILDEPDMKQSETSSNQRHSANKPSHPPSASKRSYHQSFPQKSRSHPTKHSRPNVHNNPNGAHETNSPHSDLHGATSNFPASQALPSDSSITVASEADISHLAQVFPQTSSDSNPASSTQNIKEEPASGVNEYDVNVKQEYGDSTGQDGGEQGAYDDADQSAYFGEEYYGGNQGDQAHIDYSQIQGQHGEYYQGAPGPSGETAGGDNSGKMLSGSNCGRKRDAAGEVFNLASESVVSLSQTTGNELLHSFSHHCHQCGQGFVSDDLLSIHICHDHKTTYHECDLCGHTFMYKSSMKRHRDVCGGHVRFKRHSCSLCGLSFVYKHALKRHCLLKHNEVK